MKSFELQPTDENLMSTLAENLIDRNMDVYRFVNLLDDINDACSIALDGKWGSGKTFFVMQSKMVIEAFNPNFNNAASAEDVAKIKSCMEECQYSDTQVLSLQPQIPVYYDAWSNDNDSEPVLSLVYEIIKSVGTDFSFKKGKDCLHIAGAIAEFFTGKKVNSLIELAKAEDPVAIIKDQKDIHELITEFLGSLLPEQGNRLVVFIDELDRCKPSYAVQLLERIKHYFSNDFITFVFSVNLEELQYTIKRYYGNDFDACRYLDRFFDLHFSLPKANLTRYYQKIGLNNDSTNIYEMVCKEVIRANNFQLREIAKYYRITKAAAYKPTHSNRYFSFSDEKALLFCLLCLVPIMIGTRLSSMERYEDFINGKDSSPLLEIMGTGNLGVKICSSLLDLNETYEESANQEETQVKLVDKLNAVYEALFVQDYSHGINQKNIGEMSFSKETYQELMKAVSLLSDYADFNI